MVFWHPRGYALYRVLEDYVRRKMRRAGYAEIRTPQLLPKELWGRSGHWDKFGEHMFRIDDGEEAMALKPMSCPCHVQIFNKGLRSWRELPIRYAEFGACHRNEPSGSLHGIMRTRAFEQDDAHVFCREQDVEGEVACFIALLGEAYATSSLRRHDTQYFISYLAHPPLWALVQAFPCAGWTELLFGKRQKAASPSDRPYTDSRARSEPTRISNFFERSA